MSLYKTLKRLTCSHKYKVKIATIPQGAMMNNYIFKEDTDVYKCMICGKRFFRKHHYEKDM